MRRILELRHPTYPLVYIHLNVLLNENRSFHELNAKFLNMRPPLKIPWKMLSEASIKSVLASYVLLL